jgi:fibronectin-binding autotransporter adhesin
MTTDLWNGNGDWNLNPSDWSADAPPTSTTPAEIQTGTATISTNPAPGNAAEWLTIDSGAELNLDGGISLAITDWLNNAGTWSLGAGDTVSIGGRLTNSGTLDIGGASITASTTVTAASLTNTSGGDIDLQGNASSGTSDEATLDITGTSSSIVGGTIKVLGDADLELTTGITNVASTGFLQVDGSEARISLGAGSSSNAVTGLTNNAGTVDFEGNSANGHGGTTVTTTVQFTNLLGAQFEVDADAGDGGSAVTLGGAFVNAGTAFIGNSALGDSTTVTATSLTNTGAIYLQGNAASGTTDSATLVIGGVAPSILSGVVSVSGDATLQYGSGGITTIGSEGELALVGAGAKILTSGGTSALSDLTQNDGTLQILSNDVDGAGGVTLTTTKSFTNNYGGASAIGVSIDSVQLGNGLGDGGSTVNFGGALTNHGVIYIGNIELGASTTVSATALTNTGGLIIQGNAASGSTNKASLDISGAAPSTLTGGVAVAGDATLQFGSGGITTNTGYLYLDGAGASILSSGGVSALSGLTANDGEVYLLGDSAAGAGGATLTTTRAFGNYGYGSVDVDIYSGAGGSAATFGGAFTNDGTLDIGNTGLSASTTVKATTLVNNGTIDLIGNVTSGTADKASLILSGAAASTVTGYLWVSGDATLQFHSGGITSIGPGGSLNLNGSGSQILTGGGARSALSGLTANYGQLQLEGNSVDGAGGAALTTTSAFTNYGGVYVDSYSPDQPGGSAVTFGGALTNDGTFDIGNTSLSAATTVTTDGLSNDGAISLVGSSSLADLVVNGAATTDGSVTIGAGAEIDVTGSNSFTEAGGSTTVTGSLVASTIDANDGLLDFTNAITRGVGVGALDIGSQGNLEFGSSVDSSHSVDFTASSGTLALGDAGAFAGSISGFSGSDVIDLLSQPITGLAYSGSTTSGDLTVTGSSGTIAMLDFTGNYKTSSFTFASDGHGGGDILFT